MAVAKVYLPQDAIAAFTNLESELRKRQLKYSGVCLALACAQESLTSAAKADLGFDWP
jgi:hypothetical protein